MIATVQPNKRLQLTADLWWARFAPDFLRLQLNLGR